MRGLLADVNVLGHLPYVQRLLELLDLWPVRAELKISLATFRDLKIPADLDDRALWRLCQQDGWVLFTDNRNNRGPDSLEATLADSWHTGQIPVLTLANKNRFEHHRDYAVRVATDVAELLFGIAHGEYQDQSRLFVPRFSSPQA